MKKPAKPPTNGGRREPTFIGFEYLNTPKAVHDLAEEFREAGRMRKLEKKKKRREKAKTSDPIIKPAGTELTFLGFREITDEAEIHRIADEFLEAGRLNELLVEKAKKRNKAKTGKTKP